MDLEKTKETIQRQLQELGWTAHIGPAGYERIQRFTEGREAETNQLCFKLISLGGLHDSREINDDVLDMALTDLARMDEIVQRSKSASARNSAADSDLVSIEQLAAVLESKVESGELAQEVHEPAPPQFPRKAAPAAALPKVLIADPSARTRTALADALAQDFAVIEAIDGEQAWKTLTEQPDIELLVTDLNMPKMNGYALLGRIRDNAAPAHLLGMPIIVLTGPEDANAKLRVLMAGANDFIIKNTDTRELRTRVLARHKLAQSTSSVSIGPPRAAARYVAANSGATRSEATTKQGAGAVARNAPPAKAKSPAGVAHLAAERRYANDKRPTAAYISRTSPGAKLYRISSTTTITVTATVLLLVALATISYIGREDNAPPPTARAPATTPERRAEIAPLDRPEQAPPPPNQATATMEPEPPASSTPAPAVAPPIARVAPKREPTPTPKRETESAAGSTASERPVPPSGAAGENRTGSSDRATANTERKATRAEAGSPPKLARAAPPAVAPAAPAPVPPKVEPAPTEKPATEESSGQAAPAASAAATAPEAPTAAPAPPRDQVAAVEPPPKPPAVRISRDELSTLVRRFVSVYEAGDLDQFLSMFAENARTNDRNGRRGIREDYESLFRTTDLRSMKLGEISWELDGNQAYGWGDFDVKVRRNGDTTNFAYTGSLTLVVEKVDGRLRITRLYHGQRRADS